MKPITVSITEHGGPIDVSVRKSKDGKCSWKITACGQLAGSGKSFSSIDVYHSINHYLSNELDVSDEKVKRVLSRLSESGFTNWRG